jgi:hypothetical protein
VCGVAVDRIKYTRTHTHTHTHTYTHTHTHTHAHTHALNAGARSSWRVSVNNIRGSAAKVASHSIYSIRYSFFSFSPSFSSTLTLRLNPNSNQHSHDLCQAMLYQLMSSFPQTSTATPSTRAPPSAAAMSVETQCLVETQCSWKKR